MTLTQIIEAYEAELLSIGEALAMSGCSNSVELYTLLRAKSVKAGAEHILSAGPTSGAKPYRSELAIRHDRFNLTMRFQPPQADG